MTKIPSSKQFKMTDGRSVPLPVFFPDATRAIVKTIDSVDIESTKTPGILVNTYHLMRELGSKVIKSHGGVRNFMAWNGAVISDSGGFQVMSVAKKISGRRAITDKGVTFVQHGKKISLTPEESIEFQMSLKTDMVVVLDDFTPPRASYEEAKDTVARTLAWAKRSKDEFEKICQKEKLDKTTRPYLLGVVQGGDFLDLRAECTQKLVEIGFDGLGYGGWPIDSEGMFNYAVAQAIAENSPKDYLLYGLGIGKPHEVVALCKLGYTIFDCVLPTRDARHKRLYVYNAPSIDKINIEEDKFYAYYVPDKERYYNDPAPVSTACDCLLCTHYSRAYLAHLFRIEDSTALRLATIHNLRFYSLLMEKIRARENL
ncbi:MAG: tRNA-guanine transglycosylase [Candidatus Blackburnbacteria bacterium]|nr:tRNA-guanine transglycosylase [Candidatus Blackburnbacteria bacterium]